MPKKFIVAAFYERRFPGSAWIATVTDRRYNRWGAERRVS